MSHTVEKIGGTSMSEYQAVRDNIILHNRTPEQYYQRLLVVSAFGGVTDGLLECKRTGAPGVYATYADAEDDSAWEQALDNVLNRMAQINEDMFGLSPERALADSFLQERIAGIRECLHHLRQVCAFGQFQLAEQLQTIRELLAAMGEAHSAHNMVLYLRQSGVNAVLMDLTGWRSDEALPLDEVLTQTLARYDLSSQLPVVTGYAHCKEGLMSRFDRGYSEMTFSRLAVLSKAREAIIHKEFHLSSADPRLAGEDQVIPIGRTNYDVTDQLSNLGMEAIHPQAAKGLRQKDIPLRVRNTFEPDHEGTLITTDYRSPSPCVEMVAGRRNIFAVELFDQDMVGRVSHYAECFTDELDSMRLNLVSKDMNANTLTYYISGNRKTVRTLVAALQRRFENADINTHKVSVVSAVGSDMSIPGLLARSVAALNKAGVPVRAVHQSLRAVEMQFIVDDEYYEQSVVSLHDELVQTDAETVALAVA
ncbi:aspartate kinase [Oceanisphaera avium]|uniref:aspartate kinase n=1 Tax=Oceanisphaera avium TaxID=1903694 RepID=A0A1Y0CWB4_9GAMM|nr:aspartate kinase [Oceanisphaera avium]ART79206.1 aspartate kinase [Oceanisphaera avium]